MARTRKPATEETTVNTAEITDDTLLDDAPEEETSVTTEDDSDSEEIVIPESFATNGLVNAAAHETVNIITELRKITAEIKSQDSKFSKTAVLEFAASDKAPSGIKDLLETFNTLQEQVNAVFAEINEAAREQLGGAALTDAEIASKQETAKILRTEAKTALGLIISMGESKKIAGAKEWAESITVPGTRMSRSDKGTETGTIRPKVGVIKAPDGKELKTFSEAARWLHENGVKKMVPDIHAAWFEAAGTKDWREVKTEVTINLGGKDLVIVPKSE